jgi:hypothetical protein
MADNPPQFAAPRSQYTRPIGAMTVSGFYRELLGTPAGPAELAQWLRVPEENLAIATNGEVWVDGAGQFSAVRERLLGYVPEDLRLKRIAAACMAIAQTGQYNLPRMAQRGDVVAVQLSLTRFVEAVIALVFLLNKVYKPYYKWAFRRMCELPLLGTAVGTAIQELFQAPDKTVDFSSSPQQPLPAVEHICTLLVHELNREGLVSSTDTFMTAQGLEVQSQIKDPQLSGLPAQYQV